MSKKKDITKEVMEQHGYGMGTTVGYTDSGSVFFTADSQGPEDKPMQSIFEWTPDVAESIATSLVNAAMEARKYIAAHNPK